MLIGCVKKFLLISIAISFWSQILFPLSSKEKNDVYPVYTSLDPHTYVYTREKLQMKGYETESNKPERIGLSISPFGQNADTGKNIEGKQTNLGDINGHWNMIALLFGDLPKGKTTLPQSLQEAKAQIFPEGATDGLNNPNVIDPNKKFGFFTIPLKYRKRGVRFELAANLIGDFGIKIQAGIADICQTVTGFENLTCDATSVCGFRLSSETRDPTRYVDDFTNITQKNVNDYLMDPLKKIAEDLQLKLDNFHEVSVEEIRFLLYWRHAFEINKNTDEEWPEFLFIPYFEVGGSISPGKKKDPAHMFGLAFGNSDHHAVGFTAGLNFDFYDTIEIGAEVGTTHFFDRCFSNYRVPTSTCQSGIYPFATDVTICPGHNWHFGAKILAYQFLDKLSMWFQYLQVEHRSDTIKLKVADSAFKPEVLEKNSSWKAKLANIGFNYDISPNLSLGFLWQAPISQRNIYKSTTLLFSFNASY